MWDERNNGKSGLIDDAHGQGLGRQIDTAIECVLRDIERLSENRPQRGDRHILLPRHRKMSQSPTVLNLQSGGRDA
jgi:hypothetical protein